MVPLFRNLGTRGGGECLDSPIGRFTSRERAPGTHLNIYSKRTYKRLGNAFLSGLKANMITQS
jgi:hypothetical protein